MNAQARRRLKLRGGVDHTSSGSNDTINETHKQSRRFFSRPPQNRHRKAHKDNHKTGSFNTTNALTLGEVRKSLKISQAKLAVDTQSTQPFISKLEKQRDMQISTLKTVVSAMGGNLSLVVELPKGRKTKFIKINQFDVVL